MAYTLADVQANDAYFSSGIVSSQASSDPLMAPGGMFASTFNADPTALPLGDPLAPSSPPSGVAAAQSATNTPLTAGQGSGGGNVSMIQPFGPVASPLLGTIASSTIVPLTNQQTQMIVSQNGLPVAPVSATPTNIPTTPPITTPPTPPPTSPINMTPPPMPPIANNLEIDTIAYLKRLLGLGSK